MFPPSNNERLFGQVYGAVIVILAILGIYSLVGAINATRTTGILYLTSNVSGASLSVSQPNHQAKTIGSGNARVRLKPGLYELVAASNGKLAVGSATISLHHTSKVVLDFSKSNRLRSVKDVSFSGTNALISHGLTTTQVDKIERYFFQYQPSAQAVIINPSSVQSGPLDQNSGIFTTNFSGSIDNSLYKATISFSGLTSVRLVLYDPVSDGVLFDSAAT